MPAKGVSATLEPHAPPPPHPRSPSRARGGLAPAALGSEPGGVTTVELVTGDARRSPRTGRAALHARGHPLARVRAGSRSARARSTGRWSAWRPAAPEDEDGPDPGSRRARGSAGWRIGNPWWVGPSDRIEVRTSGRVGARSRPSRLEPRARVPFRVPAATSDAADRARGCRGARTSRSGAHRRVTPTRSASRSSTTPPAGTTTRAPRRRRSSRGSSSTTSRGTAGTTSATTFSSTASGRSTRVGSAAPSETSSARTRRASTPARSGSRCSGRTGARLPPERRRTRSPTLVAWRLDLAHVDPTAALTFISGGSNRFPSGVPVLLRGVSGSPRHGLHGVSRESLYAR